MYNRTERTNPQKENERQRVQLLINDKMCRALNGCEEFSILLLSVNATLRLGREYS